MVAMTAGMRAAQMVEKKVVVMVYTWGPKMAAELA